MPLEICHVRFAGDTYLRLLAAAKAGAPDVHVHAFSPLEVTQGAATLGWPLHKYLTALRDAGLGSLPGTAAEVLDDKVRDIICPDKLSTSLWLEVRPFPSFA
jgi:FO synthase